MVTLYTIHCPNCNVLENKLKAQNIEYEQVEDLSVMQSKGFKTAPVLEVDGKIMNFSEAIKWLKEQN